MMIDTDINGNDAAPISTSFGYSAVSAHSTPQAFPPSGARIRIRSILRAGDSAGPWNPLPDLKPLCPISSGMVPGEEEPEPASKLRHL